MSSIFHKVQKRHFLECSAQAISSPHHDSIFEVWSREYLVLTAPEADDAIARQIEEEELWVFHSDWIIRQTLLRNGTNFESADYTAIRQAFTVIQEHLMEASHPMLKGLIEATCGMPHFIAETIKHNGRGHFLAPKTRTLWDVNIILEGFFIYREELLWLRKMIFSSLSPLYPHWRKAGPFIGNWRKRRFGQWLWKMKRFF